MLTKVLLQLFIPKETEMVIGIFGESCTGKSSVADELASRLNAIVYTGKDYLKIAKNEANAKKQFIELLKFNEMSDKAIIYVITEKEHLTFLPDKAFRVLMKAELGIIKERFSKRINRELPAPIIAMLDRTHGMFDADKCDLMFDNSSNSSISELCIIIEKELSKNC
jgi:cytidylate kinase